MFKSGNKKSVINNTWGVNDYRYCLLGYCLFFSEYTISHQNCEGNMKLKITENISIDYISNVIIHHGSSLSITEKEKRLLCALLENGRDGNVLCKEILIRSVWPEREQGIADTNILQLVHRLRRVLHQCGLENSIKTIYRQGYTFIPQDDSGSISLEKVSVPLQRVSKINSSEVGRMSSLLICVLIIIILICIVFSLLFFFSNSSSQAGPLQNISEQSVSYGQSKIMNFFCSKCSSC
jgi:DNA-binding winged helix-turn-helix (wHTH) protein